MMVPNIYALTKDDSIVEQSVLKKAIVFSHAKIAFMATDREKELLLRLIAFMYDAHSPFLKAYLDSYRERFYAVAKALDLQRILFQKTGGSPELTSLGKMLFNHENDEYNSLCITYWRMQSRPLVAAYFLMQEQYFNTIEICRKATKADGVEEELKNQQLKNKMMLSDVKTFSRELEEMKREVFYNDLWMEEEVNRTSADDVISGALEEWT